MILKKVKSGFNPLKATGTIDSRSSIKFVYAYSIKISNTSSVSILGFGVVHFLSMSIRKHNSIVQKM